MKHMPIKMTGRNKQDEIATRWWWPICPEHGGVPSGHYRTRIHATFKHGHYTRAHTIDWIYCDGYGWHITEASSDPACSAPEEHQTGS